MLSTWRTASPWDRRVEGPRPGTIVAALLAAVAVGALAAPPIFRALVGLGRSVPACEGLRDLTFESVASRCVLIALVLGGLAVFWRRRATAAAAVGLAGAAAPVRSTAAGFAAGSLVMACLWSAALARGAYGAAPADDAGGDGAIGLLLAGALLVGLVEETFFRGVVYGALRRRWRFWGAAVVSSLFYSLAHFARPEPVIGVAHAHWDSGLRLIRGLLVWPHAVHHYVPLAVTLFLLGLALCIVFEYFGSLYAALGLHAGIVFAMRGGEMLLARRPEIGPFWFGGLEGIAKSYAALGMAAVVLAVLLPLRFSGRPDGDSG